MSGAQFSKAGSWFAKAPVEERTAYGIVFDSKLEARVYEYLVEFLDQSVWEIVLQQSYLIAGGKQIFDGATTHKIRGITIKVDFLLRKRGAVPDTLGFAEGDILVDAKGFPTPEFKLRSKMFTLVHERLIHCVGAGRKEVLTLLCTFGIITKDQYDIFIVRRAKRKEGRGTSRRNDAEAASAGVCGGEEGQPTEKHRRGATRPRRLPADTGSGGRVLQDEDVFSC